MASNPTLEPSSPSARVEPEQTISLLSDLVYADRPLAETLQKMTVLATQVLSDAPEVSLTLIEYDRGWTAATSGPTALDLDKRQYGDNDGPCLDAARYGQTIRLSVDNPSQPYPNLRAAAQQKGVTHTLSIGLPTGDQVMGSMNIYSSTGRPLSDESERLARTFAVCIGVVLANAEQRRPAANRAENLEAALRTRTPVEQAKTIVMARHNSTSEEAFAILTRISQTRQVTIRDVSQNLVDQLTAATPQIQE